MSLISIMFGYVEFKKTEQLFFNDLFIFERVAEDESIVLKVCIKFDESTVSEFLY